MRLRFHSQSSYPLNILLFLEWLLLAIGAIGAIFNRGSNLLVINSLGLLALAGMGLYFPQKWLNKWLYTVLEFGILGLLAFVAHFPLPALLLVVMVIRNCILFADEDLGQRSAITAIFFITCSISQGLRLMSGTFFFTVAANQIGLVWFSLLIVFGLATLFLQLLVDAVMIQKHSQEQLRKYAVQIEELATVQERNRIARDIHDSLGHSLTIFNIHLEAALRLIHSEPAEAESLLLEVKQIGKKSLQQVRESVMMLRADPLQKQSLEQAIAQLVNEFSKTTAINPRYSFEISFEVYAKLSEMLKVTIYRIVQESLTNICKHSDASEVAIAIDQRFTKIEVYIRDNGKGFDLNHNLKGFGLQGMLERTLALDGDLQIRSSLDRGCEIRASFPIL
jgi:signal transduction histidine kinase